MANQGECNDTGAGRGTRRGRPARATAPVEQNSTAGVPDEQAPEVPAGQPQETIVASAFVEAIRTLVRTTVAEQVAPTHLGNEGATLEGKYLKDFKKWNPKTFNGSSDDPMVAEFWLSSVEKILRQMKCPDAYRVGCATFMLEEDAQMWWESAERTVPVSEGPVTWEQFKQLFLKKYFTPAIRFQKQAEFLNLKQGDQTVATYEREFIRLSRFAPEWVTTEEGKTERFIMGLRGEIQGSVAAHFPADYATAVRIAELMDSKTPRGVKASSEVGTSAGQKRKFDSVGSNVERSQGGSDRTHMTSQPRQQQSQSQSLGRGRPLCQECGNYHWGRCHAQEKICYNCGKQGHIARVCQVKNASGSSSQAPRPNQAPATRPAQPQQGAVFAIAQDGAEEPNSKVAEL